jgi:predicted TPR repeat methyltransferase
MPSVHLHYSFQIESSVHLFSPFLCRYSHNPRWIRELAARLGLRPLREVVMPQLRREKGVPIQGTLFVFETI